MPRRILEIGPGQNPLHHKAGLQLEQGDTYTAVDQSMKGFQTDIWRQLQGEYGKQVHLIAGDREDLPEGEFDEIVSLGSWAGSVDKIIEQAAQRLRPGGELVFGTGWSMPFNVADFLDAHHASARAHGFKYVKEAGTTYDYAKIARANAPDTERPQDASFDYATVVFIKE